MIIHNMHYDNASQHTLQQCITTNTTAMHHNKHHTHIYITSLPISLNPFHLDRHLSTHQLLTQRLLPQRRRHLLHALPIRLPHCRVLLERLLLDALRHQNSLGTRKQRVQRLHPLRPRILLAPARRHKRLKVLARVMPLKLATQQRQRRLRKPSRGAAVAQQAQQTRQSPLRVSVERRKPLRRKTAPFLPPRRHAVAASPSPATPVRPHQTPPIPSSSPPAPPRPPPAETPAALLAGCVRACACAESPAGPRRCLPRGRWARVWSARDAAEPRAFPPRCRRRCGASDDAGAFRRRCRRPVACERPWRVLWRAPWMAPWEVCRRRRSRSGWKHRFCGKLRGRGGESVRERHAAFAQRT